MELPDLQYNVIDVHAAFANHVDLLYKRLLRREQEVLDAMKNDALSAMPSITPIPIDANLELATLHLKTKIRKIIKFLQIMAHKINCPISRIVDEI